MQPIFASVWVALRPLSLSERVRKRCVMPQAISATYTSRKCLLAHIYNFVTQQQYAFPQAWDSQRRVGLISVTALSCAVCLYLCESCSCTAVASLALTIQISLVDTSNNCGMDIDEAAASTSG